MNLKNVSSNKIKIGQVAISTLNKIYSTFDEQFFSGFIKNYPEIGKENETNFILNTDILVHNPINLEHITFYNALIQVAQQKYPLLQIMKNQ